MKTIVFVAFLAAAGCSKKGPDCEASIGKGLDSFAAQVKSSASDPKMLDVIGKLRGALTQRCTEDKWPDEVVACFATVTKREDMKRCQAKLGEEQRTKLQNEIRQVMMGSMGSMSPNLPGHPATLGSAAAVGSGAPEAPGAAAGSPAPGAAAPGAGSAGTPTPSAPAGSAAPAAGSSGW
jgi:hypothetical protein